MFRRGKVFWCQDNGTGKQETLGTKDREAALRVLHAKNEAERHAVAELMETEVNQDLVKQDHVDVKA